MSLHLLFVNAFLCKNMLKRPMGINSSCGDQPACSGQARCLNSAIREAHGMLPQEVMNHCFVVKS